MKKQLKYRGYRPEYTPKWVNELINKEEEEEEKKYNNKPKEIYIKTEKLELKIIL